MARQTPSQWQSGQMTSLPKYSGTAFDGTELMEILVPSLPTPLWPTGTTYSITTQLLAALVVAYNAQTCLVDDSGNALVDDFGNMLLAG